MAYIFHKQSEAFSAETKSDAETKTDAVEADDDYSIHSEDELVRTTPTHKKECFSGDMYVIMLRFLFVLIYHAKMIWETVTLVKSVLLLIIIGWCMSLKG